MVINWIDIFIGGIVGFLSAYFFDWLKRPNILIYPNPTKQFDPGGKWVFLNIVIENRNHKFLFRNMNADQVSAWVNFLDFDSGVEIKSIRARWSSSRQPIVNGQIDYANIFVQSRESIPVGERSEIAAVVKVLDKNDHNIYAFNNESYQFTDPKNLWRKGEYSIGKQARYKVKIKVLADGYEFNKTFILLNPNQDQSIDTVSIENTNDLS